MTRLWIQTAMITLGAASVGACATPSYPVHDDTALLSSASSPAPAYAARRSAADSVDAHRTDTSDLTAYHSSSDQDSDLQTARMAPRATVQATSLAPIGASTNRQLAQNDAAAPMTPSAPEHPVAGGERASAPEHMPAPAAAAPASAPAPTPPAAASPPAAAQNTAPPRGYTPTQPPAQTAYRPERRRAEPPRMAVTGRVVASSGVFMDYEISKGDHVDALAREFATSRKAIVDANHLKAPYNMRPGQIIKIPVSKAYVVEDGDTLALIARRFDVQVAELTELNKVSRRNLEPGQKIALPATYHDRGPIRLPGTEVAEAAPRRQTYTPPAETYTPPRQTYNPPVQTTPAEPRAIPPGRPQIPDASPPLNDADVARAAKGRFVWPLRGELLQRFGSYGVGRRNDGLDIKAPQGTVVHAAADGDVVYSGDQVPGFGNLVLVKHADGWVTAYAHLDRLSVQMRQSVTQGQEIGQVGVSGGVTEPQLHFEVRYAPNPADKAKPVDPNLVLPK